MSTQKQIEANRRNGLKGGVKTEEGKAVSRLNACTHGFFSKDLLLPAEDPAYLAEIRDNYLSELKPVGELETLLVERIISSAWWLKRLVRSERIQLHVGAYKPHGSPALKVFYRMLRMIRRLIVFIPWTSSEKIENFAKTNP
jgi:hypothetical protein